MLVLIDKPGQMCNQLWSYSPYIAHAKNTGQRVVIFGLRGYRHLFPSLDQYDFIWVAPPRLSRVVNHLSWRLKTIGVKKMNIKIPGIPLRIMYSWNAPNFHALQKENASFIREVFALPDPPPIFERPMNLERQENPKWQMTPKGQMNPER